MDYARDRVWEELADRLSRRSVPRPAAQCGWVRCEPGWSWQPWIADYDIWFVIAGRGWGRIGDDEFALWPGRLVVLRPGDRGSFRQNPDDRLTVASCHFDFVDPASNDPARPPEEWLPSRIIDVIDVARLSELLRRVVRLQRDRHPLRDLDRPAAFMSALVEVYRQDARANGHPIRTVDPRLQDVLDAVRHEPSRRWALAEVAEVAGLSASHFSRLFSRDMGVSFRRFALEARLARGHELLGTTTMTVTQVASALGYDDPFLSSRQFRAHYGQPPSEIRSAPS